MEAEPELRVANERRSSGLEHRALASRPILRSGTVVVPAGEGALLWVPGEPVRVVDGVLAAALRFFDGSVSVGDLAADVAEATGRSTLDTTTELLDLVYELIYCRGLGVHPEPASAEGGSPARGASIIDAPPGWGKDLAPEGSEEVREGSESGSSEPLRSPAELAEPGTCLGHRLRAGDRPWRIALGVGAFIVVVETDDPTVAARFRDHPWCVEAGDGPVAAFVIRPFEGSGPWRVYGPTGERRGRPRVLDEVVEVVEHLLTELVPPERRPGALVLTGRIVTHEGRAIVLSTPATEAADLQRALRSLRARNLQVMPGWRFVLDAGRAWVPVWRPNHAASELVGPFEVAACAVYDNGRAPVDAAHTAAALLGRGAEVEVHAMAASATATLDLVRGVPLLPVAWSSDDDLAGLVDILHGGGHAEAGAPSFAP